MNFFWGALITIVCYYINQRIQKLLNLKILINSLFDLYGRPSSFKEYDPKEVASKLMDEILNIEKTIDKEYYVEKQVAKLKQLRLIYFNYSNDIDDNTIKNNIEKINFRNLDRGFMILCFFNIKIEI